MPDSPCHHLWTEAESRKKKVRIQKYPVWTGPKVNRDCWSLVDLKARSTLKQTSRALACPGEIKSAYLAGEVTSCHIRVNG